jgi:glycopeptide antibiotics resistance protein
MTLRNTLIWYLGNISDYFFQMLPCMLMALVLFFLLAPKRKKHLADSGLVSPILREGALLLFTMFGSGLAALTLFQNNFWSIDRWRAAFLYGNSLFRPVDWEIQMQNLQLNPGQEILRAFHGPWVMFLMLGNIAIFLPVGFFTALLWRKPSWWKSLLVGCAASCTIEFIQFFIGRSSDIDDIILNSAGALAGFWLFCLLRVIAPKLTGKFQCRAKDANEERGDGN